MKLYYSKISPYARKVIMSSMALGLDKEIELIFTNVYDLTLDYWKINPLFKIPTLQTRDGKILTNSPFICEYLNELSLTEKIIPHGPRKWEVLQIQAISDGICDAGVLRRMEMVRAPQFFDKSFDLKQKNKMQNGMAYLQGNLPLFAHQKDLAFISALACMGYVDYRWGHEGWLQLFPRLNQWYQEAKKWPAFKKTLAE